MLREKEIDRKAKEKRESEKNIKVGWVKNSAQWEKVEKERQENMQRVKSGIVVEKGRELGRDSKGCSKERHPEREKE